MSVHRSVSRSVVWLRGVFAAVPGDVGGSSPRRLLAALALGVAVLLALGGGVAQAEVPKLVPDGQFEATGGPSGVAVDNSCYVQNLSGSACSTADPSNGDVYVSGLFDEKPEEGLVSGQVDKFDASGKLLAPSPFGEGFDSGAAVNPVNGDVYVLSEAGFFAPAVVYTYNPVTGVLLSSFSVPGSGNAFLGLVIAEQIATDSSGDVYVPVARKETSPGSGTYAPNDEVLEYSPSGTLLNTFTGGTGAAALKEPTGVAVDSSGDVWVADTGNNRIEELSPSGAPMTEIKSEGVRAVALDPHGDVLVIVENSADFCGKLPPPCAHLVEYSSAGAQLADLGAGSIGSEEGANEDLPGMLAVNESSGRVYVADGLITGTSRVLVFAPPTAPVLGRELAVEVSTSEAKLGALANPGGIETSYRFEYGTTAAYGHSTPFPEGSVGEGFTSRAVWAAAGGLAPGTTYHYRVVLTNGLGTVEGPDQTFTTETAAQVSCPNEQLRGGFSASLPDCRAYELVTPPNNASAQPDTENGTAGEGVAARGGNRFSYESGEVLPGSQSAGFHYLATRSVSGWSTENVTPLQSYTADRCPSSGNPDVAMLAYSADMSMSVLSDGGIGYEGGCNADRMEVVSGEPLGIENLLLRDNTNASYQLIDVTPQGVVPAGPPRFDGASSDLSRVVFDESARLAPGAFAPPADNLYEWSDGIVRLVTLLPDGVPVAAELTAGSEPRPISAVSPDGSYVFFGAGGNLYARVNGQSTVQVDRSQGGSGPGGGGRLNEVTENSSQVLFTDDASAGLTNDTVAGSGTNLYRYDLATSQLTDLTPVSHAEVGGTVGVSEDGSYVYFIAGGVLSGSQANRHGETAQAGQSNLYLDHDGTITFVAPNPGTTNVSASGAFLAFDSTKSLTGYENTDVNNGDPDQEIFLYSAAENSLVCASCNPSGERPSGGAGIAKHSLSDNGQVFFQTQEALVPSDTNGQIDVYEYEGEQVRLISAGTSSTESRLLDVSESGDDVFFLTRQKLVPQDTNEEALSIYDARVDGGFPEVSSPPSCTTADACRASASPQPAIFGAPASSTFSGEGNAIVPVVTGKAIKKAVMKCKKGFVKKKDKCVKSKHRKAKKSKAKRASNERRAK